MERFEEVRKFVSDTETTDALWRWARSFQIVDKWMMKAAIDTLLWQCNSGNTSHWSWVYMRTDKDPAFAPVLTLNVWNPAEPWEDFSSDIRKQITKQLLEYRTAVQHMHGVLKSQTSRDADWTALYQKGMKATDIAQRYLSNAPHKDPTQAVSKAIERFAESIHLTLRSRRT
jgi:hypothetical protein